MKFQSVAFEGGLEPLIFNETRANHHVHILLLKDLKHLSDKFPGLSDHLHPLEQHIDSHFNRY